MTDNTAIIEAAARALREMDTHKSITADYGYDFTAKAVVAAVTPLVRDAALEEAASMVEQSTLVDYSVLKYFAADIRALKEQP